MDYKKKELEARKTEVIGLDSSISDLAPKIADVRQIIEGKKQSIKDIENEIRELNSLRNELSVTTANLSNRIEQNNRLNDEIRKIEEHIETLQKELEGRAIEDEKSLKGRISEKEKEISDADLKHRDAVKKIKEFEVRIEHCNETIRKINSLDICPLCEQKVDEAHKHGIMKREGSKCDELVANIKNYAEEEEKLEKIKLQIRKDMENLTREQSQLSILKLKFANLRERQSNREEKSKLKEKIKKDVGTLNSRK